MLLSMLLFHFPAEARFIIRDSTTSGRERVSLNAGWRFQRFTSNPDNLSYDKLKPWIMPLANHFIDNPSRHTERPSDPAPSVKYADATFDDSGWEAVNVPHDWAIKGPFYEGANPPVGGNMGRLPIQGVGWYRRTFKTTDADKGKAVYLEIDGAMSYSAVWLNGKLVGGWPYGYASFRLDLTPYLSPSGENNQLAIRLDQALDSSRWYPGSGIYRNVWLTKVNPVHVGQWGTYITSKDVSAQAATLNLTVQVENSASSSTEVVVKTDIHVLDEQSGEQGAKIGQFDDATLTVEGGSIKSTSVSVKLDNPKLWGPRPAQQPTMHVAITSLYSRDELIDTYTTPFGIRSLEYKGDGLYVNNQRIYLQGVCQHHDLGSLGAAFNPVAAERQLSMLQSMGTNAIRTSHNPPAPELLALADRMGFLILDEIFDTWGSHKTSHDFQTIFADWSEPDLRAFLRRDRNHPSVWAWSFGNEIAEQWAGQAGADAAQRLRDIIRSEDPTRHTTVGMNDAGPDTPFASIVDLIGLNYQGEGKGNGGATFQNFRGKFPDKMIFSTESSSVVSSRGTYLFPVASGNNAIVDGAGGVGTDPKTRQVSSYELYAVPWGASPDKVFAAQDAYPYVGGEFVWTGWDYIGEPTPFDGQSRSSYFGSIDLAGFPKDRFYLYQARWNPTVPMAHILPHWNWPDRVGQVTPVHVFSSGDEAELFVNGKSQGRKKKGQFEYRFRWDQVKYEPGELLVVAYKNGNGWMTDTVRTTGEAKKLQLSAYRDRDSIQADGTDLSFISLAVVDSNGDVVPTAEPSITFSVTGPGEIVTTDNGDPTDMTAFPSKQRKAFRGHALAIVRAKAGDQPYGKITVKAEAAGLESAEFVLNVE